MAARYTVEVHESIKISPTRESGWGLFAFYRLFFFFLRRLP